MGSRLTFALAAFGGALVVAVAASALALGLSSIENPDLISRPVVPLPTAQPSPTPPDSALDPTVCGGFGSRPAPGEPRRLSSEYTQRIEVLGILVVGNERVDPAAFDVARETIEKMFANNDLAGSLAELGAYIVIASADQGVLDIPEFRCLAQESVRNWDHICGVADHADFPIATVNELDLLGDRRGTCRGLNILFHEIGHLVQNFAISHADYIEIRILFQSAIDSGKYRGEYASTNPREYFAEGTQAYFDANSVDGRRDREWLQGYDPDLFAMLQDIYDP